MRRRRRSSDGVSERRAAARARQRNLASRRVSVVASAQGLFGAPVSGVAVSISDAIERFDLLELGIDLAELAAYPLDVAVDRAVVDVDRLAVGCVHQLVAVLDMARPLGERLQQQEFGDREVHLLAFPGALMPAGIEYQ